MFQIKNIDKLVRSAKKPHTLKPHFLLGMGALAILASGCDVSRHYYQVTGEFWEKVDSLAKADQKNQQLMHRVAELEAENERLRNGGAHVEEHHLAKDDETGHHGARSVASLLPEAQHNSQHTSQSVHHEKPHHAEGAHVDSEDHNAVPKIDTHSEGQKAAHNDKSSPHADAHGESPHAAPASASAHGSAPSNQHDDHHSAKAEGHGKELVFGDEKDQDAEVDFSIMSIPPKKLYSESIAAFKRKEYDRAARGFLALVNNKENPIYATPENIIITGICLYELQNYKQASAHFDRVLQTGRMPASMVEQAQSLAPRALSWKALSLQKLNRVQEAKQVIKKLIENYPHSKEAKQFQ